MLRYFKAREAFELLLGQVLVTLGKFQNPLTVFDFFLNESVNVLSPDP